MDTVLQDSLNSQLTFERFSADVYYSLACQLDAVNLAGMAAYMHKRADEERSHAKKFSDYLADRSVMPVIAGLSVPATIPNLDPMAIGSIAVDMALAHERVVTERINILYSTCEEFEDYQTCEFLLWFLKEQVEEVRSLEEWQTKFRLAAGNGAAIIILDAQMKEA